MDVVYDGKDRGGAILALEDRAIIAWIVGLRMKSHEAVLPYGSIKGIEQSTRPGRALSKPCDVLRIEADNNWTLVFANVFEGGRPIAPFLKGVMDGAIKPVFDGGDEEGI